MLARVLESFHNLGLETMGIVGWISKSTDEEGFHRSIRLEEVSINVSDAVTCKIDLARFRLPSEKKDLISSVGRLRFKLLLAGNNNN
jgi:hypothetical protein